MVFHWFSLRALWLAKYQNRNEESDMKKQLIAVPSVERKSFQCIVVCTFISIREKKKTKPRMYVVNFILYWRGNSVDDQMST